MYTGNQEVRWIGSSPLISTFEPIDLPKNVTRILLESHATHSKRATENNGQLGAFDSEELTLLTIVLLNPLDDLDLNRIPSVLMELKYKSDAEKDEAIADGEPLEIRLVGIPRVARKIGAHQNRYGLWEWSFELCFITLQLIDRSVRGKIRMSGRGGKLPRELQEVELDRYWEGRSTFLDKFSIQEL